MLSSEFLMGVIIFREPFTAETKGRAGTLCNGSIRIFFTDLVL